jgi:hypothetical protein
MSKKSGLGLRDAAVVLAGMGLVAGAYFTYGWAGVALALGGLIMWALLHFTRMMQVLKKASSRPKGWVGSAVMLNAKLHPGQKMLDVMRLTGALGDCTQALDTTQTEVWRWADEGGVSVNVSFVAGKVVSWQMVRPEAPAVSSAVPPGQ